MDGISYSVTIASLSTESSGTPLDVTNLVLDEAYSNGWRGSAVIRASRKDPIEMNQALSAVMGYGILPGDGATLALALGRGNGRLSGTVLRIWPSIITRMEPLRTTDSKDLVCQIEFVDPITYLEDRPVWGAYVDNSPGNIFGAALSLAAGGTGEATMMPALPGFPGIRISENLRPAIGSIPYVIACGQTLRNWMDDFFGRLGIRYEMITNRATGDIEVRLADRAPLSNIVDPGSSGNTSPLIDISLIGYAGSSSDGLISATNFDIIGMGRRATRHKFGTVIDNPSIGKPRYTGAGAVDTVLSEDAIFNEEAEVRANFSTEHYNMHATTVILGSRQPNLYPGVRLNITNATIGDTNTWQCEMVRHVLRERLEYYNNTSVIPSDLAWRSKSLPIQPFKVVSAIIDGGSGHAQNDLVARDRTGRVSISFPFSTARNDETPGTSEPRLSLRVLSSMAGGIHGTVAAHRHGDTCQVIVYHSMQAEILGCGYQENRLIHRDFTRDSTGIVIDHGGDENKWTGLVFRPPQEEESEDETTEEGT